MTEAKQNEKTGSILPPRLVSTSFLVAISIAILALFLAFAACAGVLYVHLHHASRQENLNTELSKLRNRFEQLQKKVSIHSVKKRVEDLGPKAEKVISSSGTWHKLLTSQFLFSSTKYSVFQKPLIKITLYQA